MTKAMWGGLLYAYGAAVPLSEMMMCLLLVVGGHIRIYV